MDKQTALIILDVQNVFFSEQAPIFNGEEVIKNILQVKEKAKKKGVLVITTQHLFGDMFGFPIDNTIAGEIRQELCGNIIVKKSTPNPFIEEELMSLLKDKNIKNIIIAGFQSEYCVDTSCRAARSLGFNVTLISDAHTTYSNEFVEASSIIKHTNLTMGNAFAKVISTDKMS